MEDELPPSIERIIGEDFTISQAPGSQNPKSSLNDNSKIKADDEAISNSNSPLENEKILRDHEARCNIGKIELDI